MSTGREQISRFTLSRNVNITTRIVLLICGLVIAGCIPTGHDQTTLQPQSTISAEEIIHSTPTSVLIEGSSTDLSVAPVTMEGQATSIPPISAMSLDLVGVWSLWISYGDTRANIVFYEDMTGDLDIYKPSKKFNWRFVEDKLVLKFDTNVELNFDIEVFTDTLVTLNTGNDLEKIYLLKFGSVSDSSAAVVLEDQIIGVWTLDIGICNSSLPLVELDSTHIIAFDEDGNLTWKQPCMAETHSRYSINDGKVIVTNPNGESFVMPLQYVDEHILITSSGGSNPQVFRKLIVSQQDATDEASEISIIGLWRSPDYAETIAEFKDDGSIIIYASSQYVRGSFSLDGNQLTIQSSSGKLATGEIVSLTSNNLDIDIALDLLDPSLFNTALSSSLDSTPVPVPTPRLVNLQLVRDQRRVQPESLENTHWATGSGGTLTFTDTTFSQNIGSFAGTYRTVGDTVVFTLTNGGNYPYIVQRIDTAFLILFDPDNSQNPYTIMNRILPTQPTLWNLEEID